MRRYVLLARDEREVYRSSSVEKLPRMFIGKNILEKIAQDGWHEGITVACACDSDIPWCELAVSGHLRALKKLRNRIPSNVMFFIAEEAAYGGHADVMIWTKRQAMAAINNGRNRDFDFFDGITVEEAYNAGRARGFKEGYHEGHKEGLTLKCVYEKYPDSGFDQSDLDVICSRAFIGGNSRCFLLALRWGANGKYSNIDVDLIYQNDVKMFELLSRKRLFDINVDNFLCYVAEFGRISLVKWATSNGATRFRAAMQAATEAGKVRTARHLEQYLK